MHGGVRDALIIIFALCLWSNVFAQQITLKGNVRDANTHRPIAGVNITVAELGIGTYSNPAGWFELTVVKPEPVMVVTFQHAAFDTLHLSIEEVLSRKNVDLQERLILLPVVEVTGYEDDLAIVDDFSRAVTVIEANGFELSGFVDAGDLLRTDYSIQVDEELSGKKTASIRGGTADEVIVLYNGVKMNSALDNTFDLSLIDLSEVERFEIIKGSNTTLYGPEGFSGVINIIPRTQPDYNWRLHQQFGSRETSNTGFSAYRQFGNLNTSYSLKIGSYERAYENLRDVEKRHLNNDARHHNASVLYTISRQPDGKPSSSIGAMFVKTDLDYSNEQYDESLNNRNQMASINFQGDLGDITDLNMSAAYQWSDEKQVLRFYDQPTDSGFLDRNIDTRMIHFNLVRTLHLPSAQLKLGYQFKNAELDFQDDRLVDNSTPLILDKTTVERQNHGFVGLLKYLTPIRFGQFGHLNADLSLRYDVVRDKLEDDLLTNNQTSAGAQDSTGSLVDNTWREGMVGFSAFIAETNGTHAYRAFVSGGLNVKFPTLLQQINTPELLSSELNRPRILPERNRSIEAGFEYSRETRNVAGLFGWQFRSNFFHNQYENKLRTYFLPGTPIAIYDNVKNATLDGVEAGQSFYLFDKKFTIDLGLARYFFSDPTRFSYTPDRKYTLGFTLIQSGYALKMQVFDEGNKVAQIRDAAGGFTEEVIPAFSNIDIHFSKTFRLKQSRVIMNASVRNLLDDDFLLEQLSIRERRFYISMGLEF